ncbi:MAG: xanthine dehydrogenase family protein molybdopterin-binding subunit, partial [Alphaproteobacteria bacterium]
MIGDAIPRVEDRRLLTGAGCFTDDIAFDGQLYAAFVRSPHGHAAIRSVDSAAAAAMPGVLGVWRAEDLLADGVRPFPTDVETRGPLYPNRDGSLMADPDWLPLSMGRARHVGDAVALVVADTEARARDAAGAVAVDWKPLLSVTDTATAGDAGKPRLWDCAPRNVCFDWVTGDRVATEAGLAAAQRVVSLSVVNNRLITCFMEPRAAVARFDAAAGRFELFVGCQGLYTLQRRLAHVLGVAPALVRVVTRDVGGGFGSRNVTYPEYAAVLWAARRLGCPVKWTAGRDEEFSATAQARDTVLSGRLGLDADGMFTALRVDSVCNLGAYHSNNGPFTQLRNLTRMLTSVYRVPASYLELTGVFTNKAPISSFRGVGRMEAVYMIERLIEEAARQTGIDRVTLRRRNLIPPDAMPYRANPDALYDSGDYAAGMDIALRAADWDGFEARRADTLRRGRLRGIGIGNYIEGAGGEPSEFGAVAVEGSDAGTVRLAAGCVAQGQGHETTLRQIVAAEFGIAMDRVSFTTNDTDLIPAGVGTNAS